MSDRPTPQLDFISLEIHQLHLLARATERQAEAELERRYGLRLLESRIIAIVAAAGALPFKRLTTYAQFDKSHASRLVAGLVRKGAIVSQPDPGDQRAAILRLTPEGERLYRNVHELAVRHNELWLSALPGAERAALRAALARLIQLEAGVFPPGPELPGAAGPKPKPRSGRVRPAALTGGRSL